MKNFGAMLAEDVSFHADGGGRRPTVGVPLLGAAAVMKFFEALVSLSRMDDLTLVRVGFINGLPGFVTRDSGGEYSTTALEIENGPF